MKKYFILLYIGLLFPIFSYAVDFKGLAKNIRDQIAVLPPLIIGLAIIYFLWNIAEYLHAGDAKKLAESSKAITYSVVFIFVMVSVWGLVAVLQNTFNLGSGEAVTPTALPAVTPIVIP